MQEIKNESRTELGLDISEEIKKLNEVTERYSRLNDDISEMEDTLGKEEFSSEGNGSSGGTDDVKSVREKVKMVKGDLSMAAVEVQGLKERLEKIQKKNRQTGWKVLSVTLLICIAAFVFIAAIHINSDRKKDAEASGNTNIQIQQGNSDTTVEENKKTQKEIDYLRMKVSAIELEEIAPFTAVVEEIDGFEALSFVYEDLKISYFNEYLIESEEPKRIRIENSKRLVMIPWEYDLNDRLEQLAPEYGSFTGAEGKQIVFFDYPDVKTKMPTALRMLDADKLWEYDTFNLASALMDVFELEYAESASDAGNVSDTFMTMRVGGATYQYQVSQPTYVNAVYYSENPLQLERFFELKMDEESMKIFAVVYTESGEFLGEVTGELDTVDREVVLKNVKYGAYVTPYQEDSGSNGIIIPSATRYTEYITISGSNKERYYIALSDEVERLGYDVNKMTKNEAGFYEYYDERGEKVSLAGIDVSKYQGDIDWNKVKAAGVDFAILRLGYRGMNEGTLEMDPYYEKNVVAAAKAGVKVGVYFFSQAISVEEAVEEAEMVLAHIKDYDVTWPVVFDTEVVPTYAARANTLPRDLRTDICLAFCDTIAAAGYTPMVYANTRWMILGIDLERLTMYDKWFACYNTTFTFPYHYEMLQYSEKGKVPGIDSEVDMDISFYDYSTKKE